MPSRLSENDQTSSINESHPLLATKLFIPPFRPAMVSRQRLVGKLADAASDKSAILVSAPAGFGKTTLVSEWLAGNITPTAWLSLDKGDNEPSLFINYLIAALQKIDANINKASTSILRSPQPPPITTLLINLINDISVIPVDFVLVLDDYHLIDNQQIHKIIMFLLEHQPQQMHLVIVTRSDPPLALARLRSQNQLVEIRSADLCFTTEETACFVNDISGFDLAENEVAVLESLTEGWIAGLQLAVLSMHDQDNFSDFIKSFTGHDRYVADYFIEVVLNRQPEKVQNFLLQTSILKRLSGSLCDAVCDRQSSQELLNQLEETNQFIFPLDNERHWFRYHQLFADLLRNLLNRTQAGIIADLHRRACDWYEANGFMDEALDHAFISEDFEQAAQIVEKRIETVWEHGAHTKLLNWLTLLPEQSVYSRPLLCVYHAWVLMAKGQPQLAEENLVVAEELLGLTSVEKDVSSDTGKRLDEDSKRNLQGKIAAIRAIMVAFKGDIPSIIQRARYALKYLPGESLTWRSMAGIALGDAHSLSGDAIAAGNAYSEALAASQAANNIYLIQIANIKLAVNHRVRGQLLQMIDICQQQIKLADKIGLSQTPMVGMAYSMWGEVLAEMNDPRDSFLYVNKGADLCEQGHDVTMLSWSYLCLLRVLFIRGDTARASKVIRKMEKTASESYVPPWVVNLIEARKAQLYLMEDDLDAATRWAEQRQLKYDDEPTVMREAEYMMLARVLTAREQFAEAEKLLTRVLPDAKTFERITRVIEVLILRALALQKNGTSNEAVSDIAEALSIAEPHGYVNIFVDQGPAVANLLEKALSAKEHGESQKDAGFSASYVKKVLFCFKVKQPPQIDDDLMETLSKREVEVLALIAAGYSNQGVADKLFVSLNTVRTHTKHINAKLNVHSRTQAVVKAKEMGIL